MTRCFLFFLIFIGFGLYATAQTFSPSVLASEGGIAETPNIVLEWTLGESFIATLNGDEQIFTEGYHQPVLKVVSVETPSIDLGIAVYPNPAKSDLAIRIGKPAEEEIRMDLLDLNGKVLIREAILPLESQSLLDLEGLPSNTYLLRFSTDKNEMIQTFKISKIR